MEIWKDIKGYEGLYQVSNLGKIKSLERYCNCKGNKKRKLSEKILNHKPVKFGYLKVDLCKNANILRCLVHRLVAQTYIPNPENKPQVNHKNGIKTDNRVENLEWNTNLENMRHAISTGLICNIGEINGNSKLTTEQVLAIKNDNRSQRAIAKDYNVHQTLIGRIKKGKMWSHI